MNEKISGLFVYQDKLGRNIYYDIFSKTGYLIASRDVKQFKNYNLRLTIAMIAFPVVFLFAPVKALLFASVASVLVYVVMYAMFRINLLPLLTPLPNFERPKKDNIILSTARETEASKLWIIIIMTVLIIAMIGLNLIMSEVNTAAMIVYYVVFALMGAFLFVHVAALVLKLTGKVNEK